MLNRILKYIGYLTLVILFIAAVLNLGGSLDGGVTNTILLACTLIWFGTAPFWMKEKS